MVEKKTLFLGLDQYNSYLNSIIQPLTKSHWTYTHKRIITLKNVISTNAMVYQFNLTLCKTRFKMSSLWFEFQLLNWKLKEVELEE